MKLPKSGFPSPSGVSIFSILIKQLFAYRSLSFRPLPGFLSSQLEYMYFVVVRDLKGFRPLPGFLSSQSSIIFERSYFYGFPSPSGVSIFSMYRFQKVNVSNCLSFRPLPGFLSSQCCNELYFKSL